MRNLAYFLCFASLIASLAVVQGCGSNELTPNPPALDLPTVVQDAPQTAWPGMLPADGVQPWEHLDSSGFVVPARPRRESSALSPQSEFAEGADYFVTGGAADPQGAALELASAAGATAYSIYRLALAGKDPGALSVDVNLKTGAGYYVGLADYGNGRWQWAGPFTDNNPCFDMAQGIPHGADFLSNLGNAFVAVLVYDGAAADVVGVGIQSRDAADTEAPPAPEKPDVTPVPSGLLLGWTPVEAADLAGYRVYYCSQFFFDGRGTAVKSVPNLEGGHRILLNTIARTFVRITAVDASGNESPPSPVVFATPQEGTAAPLSVQVSAASGVLDDSITVTASGAESYDFDLDGDGVFDVLGQPSGVAQVDTSATGIIRPAVRGNSGGTAVALGGASLIISGNSRPVAFATASPQSGPAPLSVTLSGSQSMDFDGEIVGGGWDVDGDGIFDAGVWDDSDVTHVNSAQHTYNTPGIYNAKLQVIDDQGAWDIDTVTIWVMPPGNHSPSADLQATITEGDAPLTVEFHAEGTSDADGDLLEYAFDWDGNGAYDEFGENPIVSHTFTEPGLFAVKLRVDDGHGGRGADTLEVSVSAVGNNSPSAMLLPVSAEGEAPFTVELDASDSDAGGDDGDSIVNYEWDFDGDGLYDNYGDISVVSHTYTTPGIFTARVRVTDSFGAQDTNTSLITVNVPDNPSPVAAFTLSQSTGPAPMIVNLNAQDSTDEDGIALYEWDWNGDGAYDSYSTSALAQHVFVLPGKYTVRLRVTDTRGAQGIVTHPAKALGWRPYPGPIDGDAQVGRISAMVLSDRVCAAYQYDVPGTEGGIKYVRSAGSSQASWSAPVTVINDIDQPLDQELSLAVIDGNPAIAFADALSKDLHYIRATNAAGTAWGSVVVADSSVDISGRMSLAEVDGAPCIAYYDATNNKLRFVRATDADGSAWDTPQTLDAGATGLNGYGPSLAVVNDNPAIAYVNVSNYEVKFIRATNTSGTAWGGVTTVRTFTGIGFYTVLWDPPAAATPTILAVESANDGDALKLIQATDASGVNWGTEKLLAAGYDLGDFDCTRTIGGVAVFSEFNAHQLYAIDNDWSGTTLWGNPYLLEPENSVGGSCQVRIGGGVPVVVCQADTGIGGLTGYYRIL